MVWNSDADLLLADARRLAGEVPQVVQLGPAHAATTHDGDFGEHGAVDREDALHADAVGDLPDRERLAHAATTAGNAGRPRTPGGRSFVAFLHPDADTQRIARLPPLCAKQGWTERSHFSFGPDERIRAATASGLKGLARIKVSLGESRKLKPPSSAPPAAIGSSPAARTAAPRVVRRRDVEGTRVRPEAYRGAASGAGRSGHRCLAPECLSLERRSGEQRDHRRIPRDRRVDVRGGKIAHRPGCTFRWDSSVLSRHEACELDSATSGMSARPRSSVSRGRRQPVENTRRSATLLTTPSGAGTFRARLPEPHRGKPASGIRRSRVTRIRWKNGWLLRSVSRNA